jgi:histidinol-phosphatase (PHP family)
MLLNLHTHTHFSDGSDAPEEYVKEAIIQGFSILGFSDHSPIRVPNSFAIQDGDLPRYVAAINQLKKTGNGKRVTSPEILLGLEYDYIPGVSDPLKEIREKYSFDYIIGSVHLVRNPDHEEAWFIDGPHVSSYDTGLRNVFGGHIREAVTAFYRQSQKMLLHEKPDIIGHLDKIKMHNRNRYFREDESWYVRLVDETLDVIRQTGTVVEVNTRGMYKKRSDTLFPGDEILDKIRQMKIPVTLTSDAHKPKELSLLFPETIKLLSETGIRSQWVIVDNEWKEVAFQP